MSTILKKISYLKTYQIIGNFAGAGRHHFISVLKNFTCVLAFTQNCDLYTKIEFKWTKNNNIQSKKEEQAGDI